ncbi:MAG: NADH-quinone oxidoreductase subunit N [Actinobacteria bacterium]|nr:NADH-quinone oxidoreductase subunit N [Actinomycetota bacterium]
MTPLAIPEIVYWPIAPVLILAGAAFLILLVGSLVRRPMPASWNALVTVAAAAGCLFVAVGSWARLADEGPQRFFSGAVVVDGFSIFLTCLVAASLAVAALLAEPWLRREGLEGPEFSALALLCASGALVMAQANDLIVLFLGLEILSIALYVMAGFQVGRAASREAAMKYFVLGSFSSAIFLYGIALVYGATGSTQLHEIVGWIAGNVPTSRGVLLAGVALLLAGLAFKVAAVPFHTWTPDVYQGAPTPVTGFMAAVAKAAGFAGLLRVFYVAFSTLRLDWQPVVLGLAVLTMVVGSVAAVVQEDVKRILAYSSIAHAGYVLIGLQSASPQGLSSALFYLFVYAFMVLGSFGVVTLVERVSSSTDPEAAPGPTIVDFRGLSGRRAGLALAFTIFLLAQAGVPFTSGFLAKFYVIGAAVEAGFYALAVLAMLSAAVAAFVYLRLVLSMYAGPGEHDPDPVAEPGAPGRIPIPLLAGVALGLCLVITMAAGILPGPLLDWARQATLFV